MEQMPIEKNKFEIKKSKAEGFLHTIETLRNMSAEGSRRYAVLSFCDLILNEVENSQSQSKNVNIDILRKRIEELREKGKDSNYNGDDELSKIIEDVKSLVKQPYQKMDLKIKIVELLIYYIDNI